MTLRHLPNPNHLPALDARHVTPFSGDLSAPSPEDPPRILLLYGSLRARSYSRFVVEEAARLVRYFGGEPRIFDPSELPLPDQVCNDDHPAVRELRQLSIWSEGQVWCSPERHGQITGVMKAQIDHLPLNMGGIRPTQGRTLAVMQVSGGSQSFNTVNTLRQLGRWMRMVTIPNQSSVPKAFQEFDEDGRMRPSNFYGRIVDVVEELIRFTVMQRPHTAHLTDRYSERKAAAGLPPDPSTDLLLRAELAPCLAADVLDDLFGRPFWCSGFVSHLMEWTPLAPRPIVFGTCDKEKEFTKCSCSRSI